MSRTIREAKPADMPEIMQVMEAAKKIMRSSGNIHQWGDGYPSEAVIYSDMENHGGFVIEEDNGENPSTKKIVGYFAFLASPELSAISLSWPLLSLPTQRYTMVNGWMT